MDTGDKPLLRMFPGFFTYETEGDMNRALGIGCGCLLAGAVLMASAGCGSVAAPATFAKYQAKDGSFDVEYPEGWTAEGGGKGHYWAKFTQGSVTIRVGTDVSGSLLNDIASAGGATMGEEEIPEELEPIALVHQQGLEAVQIDRPKYTEQAPVTVNAPMGEGRRSEFADTTSFGGKLAGYRATFLSNDRRITVSCECKAGNLEVLRPAFERVILSVAPGTASPQL